MLGLTLRPEFQGRRNKGTAIELTTANNAGAIDRSASDFLSITYPSADLLTSLEAIEPEKTRPLVLIGERGQGKSHLLASLYHALTDKSATQAWLSSWAATLNRPDIGKIPLREGMFVIAENLHRQRYKSLWELLFAKHPDGQRIKGKWEASGIPLPSDTQLLELFTSQPTALILDEFQTWFDGLTDTATEKRKSWAFNFIQILSEIANNHPDLLVFVASVRNGRSDAYQQLHRVNPVLVDFKGPNATRDRRRLLLHRLFENRLQIPENAIADITETHISEAKRLLEIAPADYHSLEQDYHSFWPYSPRLMRLLEDHVLVATDAQETRDLIRILADLFKKHGAQQPLLTAADFRVDDEESGIASLLDSVANEHHKRLRQKAQRNLEALRDAVDDTVVPHSSELLGSLWLRSLSQENLAGAEPEELQLDITRSAAIDDNAFSVELNNIVENSFNIHRVGDRLVFKEEENPQARVLASARNDRLFTDGADKRRLAKELRYVLAGAEHGGSGFRVIPLPQDWQGDPWSSLEDADRPANWSADIPVVVLPNDSQELEAQLGIWLKEQVQKNRNAVRFLIPKPGSDNIYLDRDLILLARQVLKAEEWKSSDSAYAEIQRRAQTELRATLKQRYNRFAILDRWNYVEPEQCTFHILSVQQSGAEILDAIDAQIKDQLFIPETFQDFVVEAATQGKTLAKTLDELREPRPAGTDSIPWIGDVAAQERILRLCAAGRIAVDIRGRELLQRTADESEDEAWRRLRTKLQTGRHLEETVLKLPHAIPSSGESPTPQPNPNAPQNGAPGGTSTGSEPGTGVSSPTNPTPTSSTLRHADPTAALNLAAKLEQWGITSDTAVYQIRLDIDQMKGKDLRRLIETLPDGFKFELQLEQGG